MIAKELISQTIIPLKTSDSGTQALEWMSDYYVRHLPIVNNQQLLGLLSEDDILNHDVEEAVGSYALEVPSHVYVTSGHHIFDVMAFMADHALTVVPVVDEQKHYIGLIAQEELMSYYSHSFSFSEPGSMLVLDIAKQDYSLSDISRIIESERGTILSVFITQQNDPGRIFLTLKTNLMDLSYAVASLERYGFVIKARFQEQEYTDQLKDNYNSLMRYLSV